MTEVLRRTVGTQTMSEDDPIGQVKITTESFAEVNNSNNKNSYAGITQTTPVGNEHPGSTLTTKDTATETTSLSTRETPSTDENSATTASTTTTSAIFSPKSAAVALSSLYSSANPPRQCFPPQEPPATGGGMTLNVSGTVASEGEPPASTDGIQPATTTTAPAPPTSTPGGFQQQGQHLQFQAPHAPWNGNDLAMPQAHPNNMQMQHHFQPLQPPLPPHLQQQQHPNSSPPGVYLSAYPPFHHEPPPPHHHHPHWRPHQGPWTPLVGTPGHHHQYHSSSATPGGATPHHPRAPPPPLGYSMWAPGPTMEPQGLVVYHNQQQPHHPLAPPATTKDGNDPNSLVRLASNNTSLVTPTPKKAKMIDMASRPPASQPSQSAPPHPAHNSQVMKGAPTQCPPPHPAQPVLASCSHNPQPGYAPLSGTQQQQGRQPTPPQQQQQLALLAPAPVSQEQQTPHCPPLVPTPSGEGLPPTGHSYSRKKKSLGVLAENFLQRYQNCLPGTEVIVDEAAVELGVERRRIYDVVNILESITIVCKKGKNTYSWLGKEFLPDVFGKLQAQAIADYPDDAKKYGLTTVDEDPNAGFEATGMQSRRSSMSSIASDDSKNTFRSLAKLSQQFLQVFLVGYDILSLPQASEMIQGTLSQEAYAAIGSAHAHLASRYDPNAQPPSLEDPTEFRKAAQRGLKTKIRRLYDIANVFLSAGLLRKVEPANGSSAIDILGSTRRPNFQWAYHMTPKQIQGHFMDQRKKKLMLHPQLLPPNVLALSAAGVPKPVGQVPLAPNPTTDERTPLRTLAPENHWQSTQEMSLQATSKTPESALTSSSRDPPGSVASDTSSRPSSTQSNESTPKTCNAGEKMGPPSSSSSNAVLTDSLLDEESSFNRVVLANIHQSGGYFASTPAHTRPPMFTRVVSVPAQQAARSHGKQNSSAPVTASCDSQ